jgi:hypothetical protein
MSRYGYKTISGTATADNGTASVELLAAQGAGKIIRILKGFVSVPLAGTGGDNTVALINGAVFPFVADADVVGVYRIDFSPIGYPLAANTALNLIVGGSATKATARASLVAYVT